MPKVPRLYCTSCGRSYTRGSTCRIHIRKAHFGHGSYVPEIEYIIGRLGGKYVVPQGSSRPVFQSKVKERTFLDKFGDSYAAELGKKAAHIPIQQTPVPSETQGHSSQTTDKAIYRNLFGIVGYLCDECHAPHPLLIYAKAGKYNGSQRFIPLCIPGGPGGVSNLKTTTIENMKKVHSENFTNYLKLLIYAWTENSPHLKAIHIEQSSTNNNRIYHRFINDDGETADITLPYKAENILELNKQDRSVSVWAVRAINASSTPINEQELNEFLNLSRGSTFTSCRIEFTNFVGNFLLFIGRAPIKRSI